MASKATTVWTGGSINFPSPDIDYLYDGMLRADLFVAFASQPLAGKPGERWVRDFFSNPETDCPPGGASPVTVDGANGSECVNQVALATADRGYFIRLYTSDDQGWLDTQYTSDWFKGLLQTVQLHPEDAVDASVSPSASPSSST